jgi:DNA-binding transcriptional ArsR family regulator
LAVRFHVPADAVERVGFAYSPLLEAVLSLHVLVAPKHHPLQHAWVRSMRALPAALKRRIADLAFVFQRSFPDFLFPPASEPYREFDDELTVLRELDETTVALEFLRPLWDHRGIRDPALLEDDEVQRHAVALARRWSASERLVRLIFDEPPALAEEFAATVQDYWEAAFADEWARLEPRLAETVSEAGRQIAADGVYALIGGLSRQLRVDPVREEFGKDLPHDHRVEVTVGDPLVLVPSVYVWPHVWLNCDAPWPLGVVYPAQFVAADARPRIPPRELVGVLRAVGDDTRLRALKLIAERPRSTQELAPLVGITEAGLSKHLRVLANANLVSAKREGYYVVYSLVSDRISALTPALRSFLGAPPDVAGASS